MKSCRYAQRIVSAAALGAVAAVCALSPALGDTVYLKKGGRIKGVISSETDDSIEIKSNMGVIILSRGAIAKIERAPAEENALLESGWKKERDAEKTQVSEAKKFEEDQRAKGMVKYQGTWIPAEKAYDAEKGIAKEKEEWAQTLEQQKRDLEDMEKRLVELESRLDQQKRDLDSREQQLALQQQNLLLQQQNLQSQAQQLSREKVQAPPKIFSVPRIEVVPPPPE